jgi:hypothetical protein
MFLLMKKFAALLVLTLLAACGPTPTVAPQTTPTSANNSNTNTATAIPQNVVPTALIQPTQPGITETSGLWLQILAPLDEAVVDTPQVDVIGSAPAEAVISVDDQIVIVGSDMRFAIPMTLEEGPNLIEIIASDENGNELSALLTVTYEP